MNEIQTQTEQGLGYLVGQMFQKLEPLLDFIIKPITLFFLEIQHKITENIEKRNIEKSYIYDESRDILTDILDENKIDLFIFDKHNGVTGSSGHSHLFVSDIYYHIRDLEDKYEKRIEKYLIKPDIKITVFDPWIRFCKKNIKLENKDFDSKLNLYFESYNSIEFKIIEHLYCIFLYKQEVEYPDKIYKNIQNQIKNISNWKKIT